jgi:hypothetical protein
MHVLPIRRPQTAVAWLLSCLALCPLAPTNSPISLSSSRTGVSPTSRAEVDRVRWELVGEPLLTPEHRVARGLRRRAPVANPVLSPPIGAASSGCNRQSPVDSAGLARPAPAQSARPHRIAPSQPATRNFDRPGWDTVRASVVAQRLDHADKVAAILLREPFPGTAAVGVLVVVTTDPAQSVRVGAKESAKSAQAEVEDPGLRQRPGRPGQTTPVPATKPAPATTRVRRLPHEIRMVIPTCLVAMNAGFQTAPASRNGHGLSAPEERSQGSGSEDRHVARRVAGRANALPGALPLDAGVRVRTTHA